MTDPCSGYDLLLMVYADGEAEPEERRAVEAHIAGCRACAQRLGEWQALSRHADTLVKDMSSARRTASVPAPAVPGTDRPSTPASGPPTTPRLPDAPAAEAPRLRARRPDGAGHRTLAIGVMLSLLAALLIPFAVARQERGAMAGMAASMVTTSASALQRQKSAALSMTIAATTGPATGAAAVTSLASRVSASTPGPAADSVRLAGAVAAVQAGNIYVYSVAGDRQITRDGKATAPRWSASGQWLLYETTGQAAGDGLMLTQPGGTAAPWPLPAPAHNGLARWSPSHDEIAVAARGGSLWLVQAGNDTPRQLLPPGGIVTNLAWSSDGTQLAVERRGIGSASQSLWIVSRGGAITVAPVPNAAAPSGSNGTQPANGAQTGAAPEVPVLGSWSPGNASFTYWSTSAGMPGASTPAPLALWSPHQRAQPLLPAVLMYRDFVSWAPDGHALAAVASVPTPDGSERLGQITVVPVRPPGPARQLSDAGRADGDAAWSPDGNLIAYASSAIETPGRTVDSSRRIWLEAPDGSGRRPLSPGPADSFPQWSKDGKEVLYVHQTAGDAQLWLVGRDGSDPHVVVSTIAALTQLPHLDYGASGLASYRGVFAWSDAAGGG